MDITLFWDYNSAVTDYVVEYKLHSSGIWLSAGTVSTNNHTIEGLSVCNAYDFRITAVCATDTMGTPTITSNIILDDGKCSPNNFFTLKLTNTNIDNPVQIIQVDNDITATTTTGMPISSSSSYSQVLYIYTWSSTNFYVTVGYLSGYSIFKIQAFRNGVLEYTSPYFGGGAGTINWKVPIILNHLPATGDTIEFILKYP